MWTRDGRPSDEAVADDWHLRFTALTGTGDELVTVSYRMYGVYYLAEPSDWAAFLAEGSNEASQICRDALVWDRKRGRIRLCLSVEGTDTDAIMVASMPQTPIIKSLGRAISQVVASGKYYLGKAGERSPIHQDCPLFPID